MKAKVLNYNILAKNQLTDFKHKKAPKKVPFILLYFYLTCLHHQTNYLKSSPLKLAMLHS